MEEWTSTDLHHSINATSSADELSDLQEDIARYCDRERTEIQIECYDQCQGILLEIEEERKKAELWAGDINAIEVDLRAYARLQIRSERHNAKLKLAEIDGLQAALEASALQYVLQKARIADPYASGHPDESLMPSNSPSDGEANREPVDQI